MALLDREKCPQLALAASGPTVAAFGYFCAALRAQRPGDPMNWQSWTFLGATAFFLSVTLGLSFRAIGPPSVSKRGRGWKLLAVSLVAALAVLAGILFFRDLTELAQGALFGIGALLFLEGLRRLGGGYYLRRKRKQEEAVKAQAVVPEKMAPGEVVLRLREAFRFYLLPIFELGKV